MLADKWLDHQNKVLAADSHTNIVEASERKLDGAVHYSVDVLNDSVHVKAMVDNWLTVNHQFSFNSICS